MGGFSIWHWIIVLGFLASIGGVIAAIVWSARRTAGPSPGSSRPTAAPSPTQARLAELDTLKAQQLISDEEYHQRRAQILAEI
ncbi:SHOCT domain-containing protein [Xanthomonas maliensis]|uniref:SHOCT domain-containing protein n=1 Tax=Xanthomonas maliensis TaxID=1321368 RepID=UPI00039E7C75|nr:SHOCT domain-containing protein [Xanthomonas maliensis]KAB7772513.1 hypothetical protein CKY51_00405 [Xanthomonas maliensis]